MAVSNKVMDLKDIFYIISEARYFQREINNSCFLTIYTFGFSWMFYKVRNVEYYGS